MIAEEVRKDNYNKILEVAKVLFAGNDINKVTFDLIAKESGVSRRTVINIFKTKNNLLFKVVDSCSDSFFQEINRLVTSKDYQEKNGLEQVMDLQLFRTNYFQEKPNFLKLLSFIESMNIETDLEVTNFKHYMKSRKNLNDYFTNAICKGRHDGSINNLMNDEELDVLLLFSFGAIIEKLSELRNNKYMCEVISFESVINNTLKRIRDCLST